MRNSEDDSNDSSEQERVKRVKSEKKKLKRKLVESKEELKPGFINVHNKILNTFLDARKHLNIVRDESNTKHLTINSDEELWIFQCPKNIETEDLLGRKLILPQPIQTIQSKRGNREFECKLELTKQEHHLTVICPTNGLPEAVSVKQAGMIAIRERIILPKPKENGNIDPNSTDKLFLYPTNLKIRHPLLGVNFDNIEIKEEAVDRMIATSPKKRKSNGRHSNDRIKIKEEPEEEARVSSVTKEKKRNKRPRDSIEIKVEPSEEVEVQPSKRQKHNKKARLDDNDSNNEDSTPTKSKRKSIKTEPDSL